MPSIPKQKQSGEWLFFHTVRNSRQEVSLMMGSYMLWWVTLLPSLRIGMVWKKISRTTQYVATVDSGINQLGVLYIATQILHLAIFCFCFVFTRQPKHPLVKPIYIMVSPLSTIRRLQVMRSTRWMIRGCFWSGHQIIARAWVILFAPGGLSQWSPNPSIWLIVQKWIWQSELPQVRLWLHSTVCRTWGSKSETYPPWAQFLLLDCFRKVEKI